MSIGSWGRGVREDPFPLSPFNPCVRFPAHGSPMIFLTWLRRLRVADRAAKPMQAVPVEPLLSPRPSLTTAEIATTVVAPATQDRVDLLDDEANVPHPDTIATGPVPDLGPE